MVTLAVPTYKRYDLLRSMLVLSAEMGTQRPDRYYVVDNGGDLDTWSLGLGDRLTIYKPGRNIGVAAAWNHILSTVDDEHIVISNDDQELYPETLEALVTWSRLRPEKGFFYVKDCAMFGLFLLKKELFKDIGPFDEAFFPAYFEDNDYFYRMKLRGISPCAVVREGEKRIGVNHIGSATVKAYTKDERDAHDKRFKLLETYYRGKWGGLPGHEMFTSPWNGGTVDASR